MHLLEWLRSTRNLKLFNYEKETLYRLVSRNYWLFRFCLFNYSDYTCKLMKYIIKNNLPDGIINPIFGSFTRRNASLYFMGLVSHLTNNGYSINHYLRNEQNKPLRGTIRVEVDGFYYYIELIAL